jgi:phosphoribosylamine---glycine ligase
MNVLILGSGGREHAFAWKIKQSPLCDQLFVAPGNAGTAPLAQNVTLNIEHPDAFPEIADFISAHHIQLVVVGPEVPLVAGIRDYLDAQPQLRNVGIVGPNQQAAQLEGSKDFAKAFMQKYDIPTAQAKTFTHDQLEEGLQHLETLSPPYVLKADGLAAGKGVIISNDLEEARKALEEMLVHRKFGEAGTKVVVEEYLAGIELSVFVLTDGKNYKILPEAKDYKRIGESDTGPNTGGMGSVSPVPFADKNFMRKVEERVVRPTLQGLQQENLPYQGFIFIGLMNVNGDPYVIEYNIRMGDPETQVVLPRIESDVLPLLVQTARGKLDNTPLKISNDFATTVVMVAGGYPDTYEKGKEIYGLETVRTGATVFHAGTKIKEDKVLTSGGRVLAVTGMGTTLQEALDKSYETIQHIHWDQAYFRKDIGLDLKKYLK